MAYLFCLGFDIQKISDLFWLKRIRALPTLWQFPLVPPKHARVVFVPMTAFFEHKEVSTLVALRVGTYEWNICALWILFEDFRIQLPVVVVGRCFI